MPERAVTWIIADIADREHLESLGVEVGDYDGERHEFRDCEVSDDALDRLDPFWGRYYWG